MEVENPRSYPEEPSSLCSTGLTPHILDGAFLQIMRHHFSHPDYITQDPLKCYVWDVDAAKRTILIDPVYKWDVQKIQERPAILVKRGAWQTQRMSIANKWHGPPEESGYEYATMNVIIVGSHNFFAIARTGTEAEELGAEVAYELLEFSQIIREQFGLSKFDLQRIGEVQRLDESHDHFVVPVTVTYGIIHNWRVLQQSPIWMGTDLRLQPDC